MYKVNLPFFSVRNRGDLIAVCNYLFGNKISGSSWHFLLLAGNTARSAGEKLYQFPLGMRNQF